MLQFKKAVLPIILSLCNSTELVYIAQMDNSHAGGAAVVIEKKIYVLVGNTKNVEVYDVDQGKG